MNSRWRGRVLLPRSPARYAAAAALVLLCGAGTARAQDPNDPFATSGVTVTDTTGQAGRRQSNDEVQGRYRKILAAWAGGQTEKAAADLMALETSVVRDSDAGSRKKLLKAEEAVIHEIGGANIETLVPVAMLHHEVYRRYLTMGAKGRSLLLVHSRGMTRDLAILYKQQSGSEGAALVSSRILTSLGGLLQQYAQQLPAAEMFYQALELDPRNSAARIALSIVYEKNSQYQSAVDVLRKVLAADPDHAEAKLRLALNLKRLDKAGEAQKILTELAAARPGDWVTSLAIQELARLYSEKGQAANAQKALEAAIARFPDDARLYVQLAAVLDHKGEMRAAQALMEKVLALPPSPTSTTASSRLLYNTTRQETFEEARHFLDENAHSRLPLLAEALNVPNHAAIAVRVGS